MDWKEWRRKGIGASDAPIIMGDSPYKTPYQLWLDKLGQVEDDGNNFIQNKGHVLETKARLLLEIETGLEYPALLVEREDVPFLKASLDGFNKDKNEIWEGKFVGAESFKTVRDLQRPIKHHYAQLQHQLMVSGAKHVNYSVYTADNKFNITDICHIKVFPNEDYISSMVKKEIEFWKHVTDKTFPDLSDKDCVEIEDENVQKALKNYAILHHQYNDIKNQMDEIKTYVFAKLTHPNMHSQGIHVKISKRKGGVDYKQVYEQFKDKLTEIPFKEDTMYKIIKIKEDKNVSETKT